MLSKLNKPMVGIVVGAILGAVDGATAMLYPESRPMIVSILIGSTFKGLFTGLVAGFFARKFRSIPIGILVGLTCAALVTYPIASTPVEGKNYFFEIMIPGTIVGALVGFATQKFGKAPAQA